MLIFLLLLPVSASAQDGADLSDSLSLQHELAETRSIQTSSILQKQRRSPMGALLRSVAVPGWGQFYNRRYVKAVVVFGAETYFLYSVARWWKKTEDQYQKVLDADPSRQFLEFALYQSHRDRRNDFLWLSGITIFLSMFDAYVDAHLSGFEVDLTPEFQDDTVAMLRITYRFR